ncbi:RNA polymerase sigma factor FliA [Fontimonas sp. SYSU GA230001]|uniref:RNA polymerase sigma factor FliA n=1 Tax=Fontimonas sp. SYSU GA230001 TaxID=3142450 RepID=UPI0032B366F8
MTTSDEPPAAPVSEAELVRRHADLVRRIAHHLAARLPASVEIDDLIQAGVIGLIEAVRHYSGDRGASFETYAGIRIRGAMLDELRATDWAPRSVHRRLREVAEAIRAIEQATGRDARESEVAERMGISLKEYQEIVQDGARCQVLSLDVGGDEGNQTLDAPDPAAGPLDELQRREFQDALVTAVAGLPERERLVMSLYYDDELNLKEIGQVLDVSESRVCQIHGQALMRLRARLLDWKEMQAAA